MTQRACKKAGNPLVYLITFEEGDSWPVTCAPAVAAAEELSLVAQMSPKQSLKVFGGVIFKAFYSLRVSQNSTKSPRKKNLRLRLKF